MRDESKWPFEYEPCEETIAIKELDPQKRVLELLCSTFFYGNFIPETANERELLFLLKQLGYWAETENELMTKLYGEKL